MADASKGNGSGDGVDTSVDGVRKAVEGAAAPDEGQDDEDDDDGNDADDDGTDDDSSDDDAAGDGSDDASDDDADGDDDEEEDEDDAESGDKKKSSKSDRKFSQFTGDGSDKAYISNLEEGYKNSSAEAIRIKGELENATGRLDTFMRVVANNPELATAFNKALGDKGGAGGSGSGSGGSDDDGNSQDDGLDNPFIRNLQAEWQEKSEKEIQEFIDANPEVVTDPKISADVKHWMKVFSNDYHERTGKLMSGGDAMAQAFKHLGLEDKREKQNLANGAKKNLTPPRSRGNKAKKSGGQKPAFTADQIAMAKAMGKDEAWLQKNAK